MRIVTWLMLMMAIAVSANAADDLCEIVGYVKTEKLHNNGTDIQCQYPGGIIGHYHMNNLLVGRLVMEQRILIAEIKGLREEMKSYSAGLASARANFNTSVTQIASAQESWRVSALKETLDAVSKLPNELAKDDVLRQSLAEKIKTDLAKDAEFIEDLKKSVQ